MNIDINKSQLSAVFAIFPPLFISLFLCLVLSSCSIFSRINIDITARNTVNRDAVYHALPVVVRVYTLKNPENFSETTFRELWRDDVRVLGENKLSRQEFTVIPGTTLQVTLPRNPDAQYLGAMALFRHPLHNQWRAIMPMPLWKANIILSGNSISMN